MRRFFNFSLILCMLFAFLGCSNLMEEKSSENRIVVDMRQSRSAISWDEVSSWRVWVEKVPENVMVSKSVLDNFDMFGEFVGKNYQDPHVEKLESSRLYYESEELDSGAYIVGIALIDNGDDCFAFGASLVDVSEGKTTEADILVSRIDDNRDDPPEDETCMTPTFGVTSGEVEVGTSIPLSCDTEGARIYYTTDGSEPTAESLEYTSEIIVTESVTIKAVAMKGGMNASSVASASYTVKSLTCMAPAFGVTSGEVEVGTSIPLSCDTEGARIYYTTDGSEPTEESLEYTSEIIVTESVTIKAVAMKGGMNASSVVSASYTVSGDFVPNAMVRIPASEGRDAFMISNTELTYAKWYEVYKWAEDKGYVFTCYGGEGSSKSADGSAPSEGSLQPVVNVTWRNAVVWCNAASEMEGLDPVYVYDGVAVKEAEDNSVTAGNGKAEKATVVSNANGYRLPTNDEWQFAAKGGDDYGYSGSDDIDAVAWYEVNSDVTTHDVGKKDSNGYGLYDMSGNVWEWIQNINSATDRIVKGGSYLDENLTYFMYSHNGNADIVTVFPNVGIRLVRSAQ